MMEIVDLQTEDDVEVVSLSFIADECTVGGDDREVKWYCEKRMNER